MKKKNLAILGFGIILLTCLIGAFGGFNWVEDAPAIQVYSLHLLCFVFLL